MHIYKGARSGNEEIISTVAEGGFKKLTRYVRKTGFGFLGNRTPVYRFWSRFIIAGAWIGCSYFDQSYDEYYEGQISSFLHVSELRQPKKNKIHNSFFLWEVMSSESTKPMVNHPLQTTGDVILKYCWMSKLCSLSCIHSGINKWDNFNASFQLLTLENFINFPKPVA